MRRGSNRLAREVKRGDKPGHSKGSFLINEAIDNRMFDQAIELCQQELKQNERNTTILYQLVKCYQHEARFEEAFEACQQFLGIKDDDEIEILSSKFKKLIEKTTNIKGKLLSEMDLEINTLKKFIDDPAIKTHRSFDLRSFIRSAASLIDNLRTMNRRDEAIAYCEKANAILKQRGFKEDWGLCSKRADLLRERYSKHNKEILQEAIKLYDLALQLLPNIEKNYSARKRILSNRGDTENELLLIAGRALSHKSTTSGFSTSEIKRTSTPASSITSSAIHSTSTSAMTTATAPSTSSLSIFSERKVPAAPKVEVKMAPKPEIKAAPKKEEKVEYKASESWADITDDTEAQDALTRDEGIKVLSDRNYWSKYDIDTLMEDVFLPIAKEGKAEEVNMLTDFLDNVYQADNFVFDKSKWLFKRITELTGTNQLQQLYAAIMIAVVASHSEANIQLLMQENKVVSDDLVHQTFDRVLSLSTQIFTDIVALEGSEGVSYDSAQYRSVLSDAVASFQNYQKMLEESSRLAKATSQHEGATHEFRRRPY